MFPEHVCAPGGGVFLPDGPVTGPVFPTRELGKHNTIPETPPGIVLCFPSSVRVWWGSLSARWSGNGSRISHARARET